jgi:predicted ATPase
MKTNGVHRLTTGLGNGCGCNGAHGAAKRIVVTGGPGAGKTAVLELAVQALCSHVVVLPEAAGIVFGGGFPRGAGDGEARVAQRAIFHVQRELESLATLQTPAVVLCDRGTVDGSVYWRGDTDFFADVGTSHRQELERYDLVIHLHSPTSANGYNRRNPLRIETAEVAHELDSKILAAWADHPHRVVVDVHRRFIDKAAHVLDVIRAELPPCCVHGVTRP